MVSDVKLEVSVVAGSANLPIRQLLKLGRGAIIPLETGLDDPVTVFANAEAIASGLVETSNDRLQVRISHLFPGRRARAGALE